MASARQLINQLHLVMYSVGTTESLVRAVRASEAETFAENLEALKISGNKIEKSMNYLAQEPIQRGTLGRQQVSKNFNNEDMKDFFDQLLKLRNLILSLIYIVLREMG